MALQMGMRFLHPEPPDDVTEHPVSTMAQPMGPSLANRRFGSLQHLNRNAIGLRATLSPCGSVRAVPSPSQMPNDRMRSIAATSARRWRSRIAGARNRNMFRFQRRLQLPIRNRNRPSWPERFCCQVLRTMDLRCPTGTRWSTSPPIPLDGGCGFAFSSA